MLEVEWKLTFAHMLKHANAHNFIEAAWLFQRAVIAHVRPTTTLQAGLDNALIGEFRLVLAERDAESVHAIVLGGMDNQTTPPTTNVEQPLARAQTQLAAQVIEFAHLGSVRTSSAVSK